MNTEYPSLTMERVTGFEPVYPTWKAGVLAIVLYPQNKNSGVIVTYLCVLCNILYASSIYLF